MKIVFMGTPMAAVPTLDRILSDGHDVVAVYSQPDRPSGRGNKIKFSPVKEFALENDLPVLQPLKLKTTEALETFRSYSAEVAVVVAYGRILPETFLTAYPRGAINVHFSLLPTYRGAAPVNWAIVNGESFTGVTTMKMDAGLDTGDILLQCDTEIRNNETAQELMERLSFMGAELLSETLLGLDNILPQTQDHSTATIAPILRKEDGIIDWKMPAIEIVNRIRGFQPFPSSYTFLDGLRLTIWDAEVADFTATGKVFPAGEIVKAERDQFVVSCGGGMMLQIHELQLEGKKRMSTRDFLNGIKITFGAKLEN
ncbi:MAG: methionyl-tRNA formyltransferase [Blastocatellia bacterium]